MPSARPPGSMAPAPCAPATACPGAGASTDAGLDADLHYAMKANDHLAILRLFVDRGRRRRRGQRGRTPPRPRRRHSSRPDRVLRRRQVGSATCASRWPRTSARSTSKAPRSWTCCRPWPPAWAAPPASRCGSIRTWTPRTHAKISTGRAGDKFGIPWADAAALYAHAASLPGIAAGRPGDAYRQPDSLAGAVPRRLCPHRRPGRSSCARPARSVDTVDCGGGLGIPYRDEPAPSPDGPRRRAARGVPQPRRPSEAGARPLAGRPRRRAAGLRRAAPSRPAPRASSCWTRR